MNFTLTQIINIIISRHKRNIEVFSYLVFVAAMEYVVIDLTI